MRSPWYATDLLRPVVFLHAAIIRSTVVFDLHTTIGIVKAGAAEVNGHAYAVPLSDDGTFVHLQQEIVTNEYLLEHITGVSRRESESGRERRSHERREGVNN